MLRNRALSEDTSLAVADHQRPLAPVPTLIRSPVQSYCPGYVRERGWLRTIFEGSTLLDKPYAPKSRPDQDLAVEESPSIGSFHPDGQTESLAETPYEVEVFPDSAVVAYQLKYVT